MESNSVFIINSLDGNSFIIKSNNTELYTLSGIYNSYNSLYGKCLEFFVL